MKQSADNKEIDKNSKSPFNHNYKRFILQVS